MIRGISEDGDSRGTTGVAPVKFNLVKSASLLISRIILTRVLNRSRYNPAPRRAKHWSTPTPAYVLETTGCHTNTLWVQQTIPISFYQHYIISDSHTHRQTWLTSCFEFLYAHVDHHGSLGVVGFDQRGEVAAVHLLDVPQVWLAVVGHDFGALLVDVQAAV